MYRFASIALVALLIGCASPTTTTINLPPADVNGQNFLMLTTAPASFSGFVVASAKYRSGQRAGFSHGTLITCNGFPLVDTRNKTSQRDTSVFLQITQTNETFSWHYEGLDTTFDFTTGGPSSTVTITNPRAGNVVSRFTPFTLTYAPTVPTSLMQVKLTDFQGDTVTAKTQFDPSTGEIGLVTPDANVLRAGNGNIELDRIMDTTFSTRSTHSVSISHQALAASEFIVWQ